MRAAIRRFSPSVSLWFALFVSCTSHPSPTVARPQSPQGPSPSAAPDGVLHNIPLRVLSTSALDAGTTALRLSLDPDGSVILQGRLMARVYGFSILDAERRAIASFTPDGAVRFDRATAGRFDGADIVSADGTRLRVRADGSVVFVRESGAEVLAPVRVEGIGPEASERERLTAAAMVLLVMLNER